jgi:uncharacterized membrane protein
MSSEDLSFIKNKLADLDKKQKKILSLQKKLLKKELEILELEKKIFNAEEKNLLLHQEFHNVNFGKFLNNKKAMLKTTYKDIVKGVIGAFFGIMGHFAFVKGTDIAYNFSFFRSSLLFITSFFILFMFIYFSGFRVVKMRYFLGFLPVRASVLYISAIFTVFFVLLLYGMIDFSTPVNIIYNYVASVSILAVLGAGTSDLIGSK